jgi:hypothetical protein
MVIPGLQVRTWKRRSLVRPQPDASSSESDGYTNLISLFDHLGTVEGDPRGDPECQIWQRLVTEKQPIFFVGKSHTRALPMALAAMRESFQDIWATSLQLQAVPDKALDQMLKELEDRMQIAHTSGRPVVFFQRRLCVLTIHIVCHRYLPRMGRSESIFETGPSHIETFHRKWPAKKSLSTSRRDMFEAVFDEHKGSPSSKKFLVPMPMAFSPHKFTFVRVSDLSSKSPTIRRHDPSGINYTPEIPSSIWLG